MKPQVRKAQRLMRVRTVQHNLAAVATHKARQQVEALEASIGKLVAIRDAMQPSAGGTTGAMLASSGEIAMRLDQARASVMQSADGARRRAEICREAQLAARQNQETADRLTEKAVKAVERAAERKQLLRGAPRKRNQE